VQAVDRLRFRELAIALSPSFRRRNELPARTAAMTTIPHPPPGWQRFVPPAAAVRGPLLTALGYFVGAESAFLVGTLSDRIFAPFWPPNVILFAALLLAPTSRWWLYVLATVPAHVIAEMQVGMPLVPMAVAFASNCAIALLAAFAVRRRIEGAPWLGTLAKASTYVLITALLAPALVALGGAFVPIFGGAAAGNYLVAWTQWFLANSLGFVTLGPIVLTWFAAGPRPWSGFSTARLIEATAITVALVVVSALAFHFAAGTVEIAFMPALLYSPLPLILWAATRFGEKGASGAVLVVTVALLWLALNRSSLFVAGDPERNVLALQIFLIGLAIPVLLLGATIEEVRRAEAATRESEARMQFAAASANVGLWSFERTTGRLWATVHCRAILGLAPDAPLTRNAIEQVIHPDDREAAIELMQSAAFAGRDVVDEFRVVLPDGGLRWLRARARADHDAHGAPIRVSGVFIDITKAKQAEHDADLQRRELAHLMRVAVMGELSGAIAHELNQPLTAILSNAEATRLLLANPSPDLTEVGAAIDDIVHESKRAGAVIDRMRGLLKKDQRPPETLDLNGLIRSTVDLLHSELIARRLAVSLALTPDLPQVFGDCVQLQQVLLNLVMNAMDATAAAPVPRQPIIVRTRLDEAGAIETAVTDRGAGLPPAAQGRAFEPFFTTKPHGLGLGLSICSTIVAVHGGQLALANAADGGARAIFTLPARPIRVAAA
jgi:PAS domain S-box-containing protein